jgi:hypothetical protein
MILKNAILKMIFNFNIKDMLAAKRASIRDITVACDFNHMGKLVP